MPIDGRTIAQFEAKAFGGKPKVHRYSDDDEVRSINILSCVDGPHDGVTSYATVDLSGFDTQLTAEDGRPIRVELLGACDSAVQTFGNVMTTCALNIASGQYSPGPGRIHPRVIELYEPTLSMRHILFVPPFLWGPDAFPRMEDEDVIVLFLQLIPISDAELDFARAEGADALESRFEQAQIDIYDLNRPSVV